MDEIKFIISAQFHPYKNNWTGLSVEIGKKGTHDNYNIVYNGICNNEYFKTEKEAKQAAMNKNVRIKISKKGIRRYKYLLFKKFILKLIGRDLDFNRIGK